MTNTEGRTSQEECEFCEESKDQHPVFDDNGNLACTGPSAWYP